MPLFQNLKALVQHQDTPVTTEGVEPAPATSKDFHAMDGGKTEITISKHAADPENQKPVIKAAELNEAGAQRTELIQEVWGKHGRLFILVGIAFCMIVYEFDNTTFPTYYVYAISSFQKTASSSALAVACNLTFSLLKPVWAKVSDIFGRGEMYPMATVFILLGMIVSASATNFNAFAAGNIFRIVGITCLNTMNTIVIADLTSTRQRAFGVNIQFWPYLILPWISSYIISAVVSPGGIGWAWGIGILAIIYPFGIAPIMSLLMTYQRRAKKLEVEYVKRSRVTIYEVCSNIDMGGLGIMITGLAFILLPLSLASLQPKGYRTPWVIALMVIGGLLLIFALPFYESKLATHPFFPVRYLKNRTIVLAFLLYFTDYMAAASSHSYLYNWAVIAKGYNIVQATNLTFINSTLTFATGIVMGIVVWKTKQYKWWLVGGLVIRLIGYGVMFRIRTADPSMAEVFLVQVVQGLGDGMVQTGGYVAATVNVPHKETASMTALIVMVGTLGTSIGDAICGAIYTGTFRQELAKQLGDRSTPELVEALFNSITTLVPEWGTPERMDISAAYDNVTSYFYIAAIVLCVPGFFFAWFLPNQKLNDNQNLFEDRGMVEQRYATAQESSTQHNA